MNSNQSIIDADQLRMREKIESHSEVNFYEDKVANK